MKPISPCRSCKATSFVFIPAKDWPSTWGKLPPGSHGGIFCLCGTWAKWAEARAEQACNVRLIVDGNIPHAIDAQQRDRAASMAACEERTKKQGRLL